MHLNIIFGSKNQFLILDVNQNKNVVFLQYIVLRLALFAHRQLSLVVYKLL
jgi:hypothetical protein